MDNTFKRRNLFALLLDLFAAALVGEAAGGGSWRLSLIGGTRLITFYRASLSLAKPLGSLIALQPGSRADSYSSRLNCAGDVVDQSERCTFATQQGTPSHLSFFFLLLIDLRLVCLDATSAASR